LAPKKILIVDDEPDITFTLKKGLEQGGYDVHVFNEPLGALMVAYYLVKNFSEVS
jgi:DNA-binding response OmpR family regulator